MRAGTTAKRTGALLLCVSIGAILALTLDQPELSGERHAARCYLCAGITLPDILRNLALFVPLGAALTVFGVRTGPALAQAFALSAAIELAQLWIPGRESSWGDLVCNTLGAGLGVGLARSARIWLRPAPRSASRLALIASLGVAGGVALTGWLFEPSFTPTTWYAGWVPELGYLGVYRGYVRDARIGDVPLPSGRLPDTDAVRRLLRAGAPVRVRALAGPDPERLSPLLTIHDGEQREMLVLGAEHGDLIYRQRLRAADFRLEQPSIRIAGGLAGTPTGSTLEIEVERQDRRYCVTINGVVRCGLGHPAGRGWAALFRIRAAPLALRRALDALWLAGLALPVGLWFRMRAPGLVALAVLLASVTLLPPEVGLLAPRSAEGGGIAIGLLLGLGVQRMARARA